jgi:hypothetical protein
VTCDANLFDAQTQLKVEQPQRLPSFGGDPAATRHRPGIQAL